MALLSVILRAGASRRHKSPLLEQNLTGRAPEQQPTPGLIRCEYSPTTATVVRSLSLSAEPPNTDLSRTMLPLQTALTKKKTFHTV